MTKRIKVLISLILIVSLLCCLPVGAGADETGVCFVATNDTLLDLSLSPVFYGSTAYVSARIFAYFGIYYSFFSSDLTAELYNESRQIFFDMEEGNAYDADLNPYDVSAVYRNGVAYVPVSWTCRYFGLSYSLITGKGSGDILRIKNGGEVLSDNQFLGAASSLMQSRYNEYYGAVNGGNNDNQQTTPNNQGSGKSISLAFIGMPDYEMMDSLNQFGAKAAFFLTAKEAESDSDMLRRIICEGHSIGIYCEGSPSQNVPKAMDAVYKATLMMPTLLSAPKANESACSDYADDNAMSFYSSDTYHITGNYTSTSVMSSVTKPDGSTGLCFTIDDTIRKLLPSLLRILDSSDYTVIAVRETD